MIKVGQLRVANSEGHREGEITVLREDNKVVAFQLGHDVLEVKPDKRGKGYGRTLAEHWIEKTKASGTPYLFIECAPPTSLGFWKKLGFRKIPDRDESHTYALRILNNTFELPEGCQEVAVKISFYYPSSSAYVKGGRPIRTHRPRGVRDGNRIKLAERLIEMQPGFCDDLVMKIEVDGDVLYLGRAKDAQALGIKRYRDLYHPAFYCDYLIPSGTVEAL
jgi:hypothetical protein